jgi:hypothetical protein
MMTTILIAALALSAPVNNSGDSSASTKTKSASSQPAATSIAPHELRAAVTAALRGEAIAKPETEGAAVRQLVAIYRQLQADRRMAPTERERLRNKVRMRLLAFGRVKAAELFKAQARARRAQRRKSGRDQSPASIGLTNHAQTILAQVVGGMGQAFGGPAAAGQGGGQKDDGQALVDLIQTVISPEHWDVNGGPGSIIYFGSMRVLVVRASDDVHHNLGGVMENLRRVAP